jgi:hypothetical protein
MQEKRVKHHLQLGFGEFFLVQKYSRKNANTQKNK